MNERSYLSMTDKQKKILAWAVLSPFILLLLPLLCVLIPAGAVVWAIETLADEGEQFY